MINYAANNTYSFPSAAFALESLIRTNHYDALGKVSTTIAHPRSLARPMPTWRPPSIRLADTLQVAVFRHRVGTKVRARLRGFGETRTPAYLVSLRFSDTSGRPVPSNEAEAWIKALLPQAGSYAVHQLLDETTPTFCWLVNQHYEPLDSPASLFNNTQKAA